MRRRRFRFLPVVRRERGLVLFAAAWFFTVLAANFLLRPVRESLGVEDGIDTVRWLFGCTLLAMLAANPLFALVVRRWPRRRCVGIAYRFGSLCLIGFFLLLVFGKPAIGVASGRVFYVWMSVFNLFAVSLFWAFLADCCTLARSARLYGLVAVGGTLGAIAGAWAASLLAGAIGSPGILLLAAGLLEVCLLFAWGLDRSARRLGGVEGVRRSTQAVGGSVGEGLRAVVGDSYLRGVSLWVLAAATAATAMYFVKLRIVAGAADDLDARTAIFAHIDLWTQLATLAVQLFATGPLLRRAGTAVGLAALPVVIAAGFALIAIVPTVAVMTLFEAIVKATRYGLARPAFQTLFTVVSRADKYKAKPVIDTFVYRAGDAVGAAADALLSWLVVGAAATTAIVATAGAAVPVSLGWAIVGVALGRAQRRRAREGDR